MLNVTNPMTALTRAVTRETAVKTVGLCHEVTNARFFLSLLLDCGFFDVDLKVTGVNHLPVIVAVEVDGRDRMPELVALAEGRGDARTPLPVLAQIYGNQSLGTGGTMRNPNCDGEDWTKQSVLTMQAVNYEVLARFGALPGADSDHTAEFFPGFLTEESGWGKKWGLEPVTIEERRGREARYAAALDAKLASDRVPAHRSPEMIAPVIESLVTGTSCALPLNVPNRGQCPDLPDDVVVESICTVDGDGIRGRDVVDAPPLLAEWLRRVSASQELTVEAAVRGDGDAVLGALLADPLAGRGAHEELLALRDDILTSTAPWLPQFS